MMRIAHVLAVTLVASLGASACGVNEAAKTAPAGDDGGKGGAPAASSPDAVRPFTIDVSQPVLDDLRERLKRTRFPGEIDGTGWDYGANRAYMKDLVAYWRDTFDWRAQERRLNQFDQFKTTIDGLEIHFIHQRSKVPNARPLIITHGWPGSIVEFVKIIDPLTDPAAHGGDASQAFHIVAPSIPGFGFSDQPNARGYNPERIARMFATLMQRLGYERYGAQGGDYGSAIMRQLAILYPDRVIGLHLNLINAGPPPGAKDPTAGATARFSGRSRRRSASRSTTPPSVRPRGSWTRSGGCATAARTRSAPPLRATRC
jgi:epoxide hydrolase